MKIIDCNLKVIKVNLNSFTVYTLGWLEGAQEGVEYLFNPEWDKVLDPNIWAKAAGQILFSLSVGFGAQLVLASYNNFKNNTLRQTCC